MERHGRTADNRDEQSYFRLEFEPPVRMWRGLDRLLVPCVACGSPTQPFRRRFGSSGAYYTATCRLGVSPGCCRSQAARLDHDSIVAALGHTPRASALQGTLW